MTVGVPAGADDLARATERPTGSGRQGPGLRWSSSPKMSKDFMPHPGALSNPPAPHHDPRPQPQPSSQNHKGRVLPLKRERCSPARWGQSSTQPCPGSSPLPATPIVWTRCRWEMKPPCQAGTLPFWGSAGPSVPVGVLALPQALKCRPRTGEGMAFLPQPAQFADLGHRDPERPALGGPARLGHVRMQTPDPGTCPTLAQPHICPRRARGWWGTWCQAAEAGVGG